MRVCARVLTWSTKVRRWCVRVRGFRATGELERVPDTLPTTHSGLLFPPLPPFPPAPRKAAPGWSIRLDGGEEGGGGNNISTTPRFTVT